MVQLIYWLIVIGIAIWVLLFEILCAKYKIELCKMVCDFHCENNLNEKVDICCD